MPCRLATAATGSRSPSRMIATICSSEKRPFRIAPSESGASLSTYRWSENPGAGQVRHEIGMADMLKKRIVCVFYNVTVADFQADEDGLGPLDGLTTIDINKLGTYFDALRRRTRK